MTNASNELTILHPYAKSKYSYILSFEILTAICRVSRFTREFFKTFKM